MDFVRQLVLPLVLTILLELIILVLLKEKRKKVYVAQILMNVLTNTSLNVIVFYCSFQTIIGYLLFFILAEFIVLCMEALFYFLVTRDLKKSFLYALFCNAFSAFVGLGVGLLMAYLG